MTVVSDVSRMQAATAHDSGTVPIIVRLFRDYVRPQWRTLALAVVCMAVTAAMTAALALLTDPVIKYMFLEKRADLLILIPLAVMGVVVIRAVTQFAQQSLMDSVGERAVAQTQRDMLSGLIRQDICTLSAIHSGQFVSNFIYDATLMRDAIVRGIAGIGLEFISLIGLGAVMVYQDWRLALISVFILPVVGWVSQVIGASLRRSASRGMEIAATIGYAGYQTIHGQLGINHFFSFLTAMLLALQPVRNLTQLWATASSGLSAADRIFAVIDERPRIRDRPGAAQLTIAPGSGAIAFEGVSFSYGAQEPSVNGVTFAVTAGAKVALVGPSGAGKSTIFNLLLRFYDIKAGRIAIDGRDIRDVTLT